MAKVVSQNRYPVVEVD